MASFVQGIRQIILWGLSKVVWAKFPWVQAVYRHKGKECSFEFRLGIAMKTICAWKHPMCNRKWTLSLYYTWEGHESTFHELSCALEGRDHGTLVPFSWNFLLSNQNSPHTEQFVDFILMVHGLPFFFPWHLPFGRVTNCTPIFGLCACSTSSVQTSLYSSRWNFTRVHKAPPLGTEVSLLICSSFLISEFTEWNYFKSVASCLYRFKALS